MGLALLASMAMVTVRRDANVVVVQNRTSKLTIHLKTGEFDVVWSGLACVSSAHGEVRFDGGALRSTNDWDLHTVAKSDVTRIHDGLGNGICVVLRHRKVGSMELRHRFWIYDNRPEVLARLEVVGVRPLSTNYLAPVVSRAVLPASSRLNNLFVPYDNDNYARYRSDGWNEKCGSHEVGALYDPNTRHGLVVGSVEHDTWKSAVEFDRKELSFRTVAGVTSSYTHDSQPHGSVSGREVFSPKMSLGAYADWRDGLEAYGRLNALVKAALPWSGSVPFGWNSWSAYKAKLTEKGANAARDFLQYQLPGFRSGRTAYVNLDSFWDNLTLDARTAFVHKAHAAGLKAGIYWTPFVAWGSLESRVNGKHDTLTYRDLVLKDVNGAPLAKLDGGWALDPTHPGTLARIDRQMAEFVRMGFDFVKLDFMTHGALEGKHFNKKVMTGTQAYNLGMKRIVESVSRSKQPIFLSLSIAPMFPHGYAHSRRTSCDVFANIGASEYLLNSTSYGWWTGNSLYRFNDPDSACVYQPQDEIVVSEAEARTRFTASVVSGGMMFVGDDLLKVGARDRVRQLFHHRELLELAQRTPAFRSIEGDSGYQASEALSWQDPKSGSVYLALFNYDAKLEKSVRVNLTRLGLRAKREYRLVEMWSGRASTAYGAVEAKLGPAGCALFRIW